MAMSIMPPTMNVKIDRTKLTLPGITGVRPLSRNEIKKDLYEIECFDKSDSESVVSVQSDDVLPSSYPVKPRRHLRVQRERSSQRAKDPKEQDAEQTSVEDAIEFLRIVESARPEIFDAEREREDLEIRYQALKEMCIIGEEAFKKRKKGNENFIGAMQMACRKSACEFQLHSQYNSMLSDIIYAVKVQKDLIADFSTARLATSKINGHSTGNGHPTENMPFQSDSSKAIVFYISQVLNTPMGPGRVKSIHTDKQSLTIQLPFGLMYSAFCVAASWFRATGGSHGEYHHPISILQRWRDTRHTALGGGIRQNSEIAQILHPVVTLPPVHVKSEIIEGLSTKMAPMNGRRKSGGGKNKRSRPNDAKADVSTTLVSSVATQQINVLPVALKGACATVSIVDDSDKCVETYDFLDVVPRIQHAFVGAGTLPFMMDACHYRPVKTETSSGPPPGSNTLTGEKALRTIQMCPQAVTTAYRHPHSDLDDMLLLYPAKENDELEVNLDEMKENEVRDGKETKCVTSELSDEYEQLLRELRPVMERIRTCLKEKTLISHQVEMNKKLAKKIYEELSCARLNSYTHRLLTGRYVPPPVVPEVRSTAATKAAERRARSAANKAAAIAAAAALTGIAHGDGGGRSILSADSFQSDELSLKLSQEPLVQYTYDSIGRRRPIKPAGNKGHKRRQSDPISRDSNVHIVHVSETTAHDLRRPKRARR